MSSAAHKHDEPTGRKSRDALARKIEDSISQALSTSLDRGELDRVDLERFRGATFKLERVSKQGRRHKRAVVMEKAGQSDRSARAGNHRVVVVVHEAFPGKAAARKPAEPKPLEPLSKVETRPLRGAGMGEVLTPDQGRERLDAVSVDDTATDWVKSPLQGSVEMAAELDVSRTTLDSWRKRGLAVAFPKGLRNFVFPTVQFKRSRPVEGLDLVLQRFETPEEAWHWLVTENPSTKDATPLERLKKGKIEEVIRAAEGVLDFE